MAAALSVEQARPSVAVVCVDHPPANSLTYDLRLRIRETWGQLQADDAVKAIVVTGAGDRFFSAGLDLAEVESWRGEPETMHERVDRFRWDPESAGLWKPTIAAINGYCLAGGWYLAQMCDVRIAADHALFGLPEGRWGLPATFAWSLPRLMPLNLALESVLWAERRHSAERMFEIGWLNAVVPGLRLMDVALDWASEVAALPAASTAAHKKLLYATAAADGERLRAAAEGIVRALYDSPDAGVGIADFLGGNDPASESEVNA